jgi:hypothetical protein
MTTSQNRLQVVTGYRFIGAGLFVALFNGQVTFDINESQQSGNR